MPAKAGKLSRGVKFAIILAVLVVGGYVFFCVHRVGENQKYRVIVYREPGDTTMKDHAIYCASDVKIQPLNSKRAYIEYSNPRGMRTGVQASLDNTPYFFPAVSDEDGNWCED